MACREHNKPEALVYERSATDSLIIHTETLHRFPSKGGIDRSKKCEFKRNNWNKLDIILNAGKKLSKRERARRIVRHEHPDMDKRDIEKKSDSVRKILT